MNDEVMTTALRLLNSATTKAGYSNKDINQKTSQHYIETISAVMIEMADNEKIKRLCAELIEGGLQAIDDINELFPEAAPHSEYLAFCFASLAHCLLIDRTIKDHNDQIKKSRSILAINRAKQTDIERARVIATELWKADTAKEFRIKDMAKLVTDILKREQVADLPALERIKEWIKPVAPSYASLGGRRKTP
ncbi:hypothetical protein C4E44_16790 [Pseudomonas sp. MWU12-2312b]|nr:hypothetical protein C4E44_16790 [Pseudomonas sp. MWU12-2312b]